MSVRIPIKVDDIIVSSVLEIRFVLDLEKKNFESTFMPLFLQDFPNVERANEEIPPSLREADISLRYLTEYRFYNDDFVISIGQRAIVFEFLSEYGSWKKFYTTVEKVLKKIRKQEFTMKIERVGLRYYNVIEGDWELNKVVRHDFKFPFEDDGVIMRNLTNRYELEHNNLNVLLTISSKGTIGRKISNTKKEGIVLDIDVSKVTNLPNSVGDQLLETIKELHNTEKFIFFNLITKDYLDSRNPKYD